MYIMLFIFTRIESYLAEHDPFGSKRQPKLNETADSPVQLDADIPGRLEYPVFHVSVSQRFRRVYFSSHAE